MIVHKIKISEETLRSQFQQEHIPYKSSKKRPRHQWQEQKVPLGEMVQMEGFPHDWFEAPWNKLYFHGGQL